MKKSSEIEVLQSQVAQLKRLCFFVCCLPILCFLVAGVQPESVRETIVAKKIAVLNDDGQIAGVLAADEAGHGILTLVQTSLGQGASGEAAIQFFAYKDGAAQALIGPSGGVGGQLIGMASENGAFWSCHLGRTGLQASISAFGDQDDNGAASGKVLVGYQGRSVATMQAIGGQDVGYGIITASGTDTRESRIFSFAGETYSGDLKP